MLQTRRISTQSERTEHAIDTTSTTSSVEGALRKLGDDSPSPFDRTTITYCGVDAKFAGKMLPSHPDSELYSHTVAIVVAVQEVIAPMYLADMTLASDLIDYLYGGAGIMLHADTPEEAVERYQENIIPVETPDQMISRATLTPHSCRTSR
jgi:hypothetical protein